MGVVGLAWYICGLSALLAVMASLISVAPPGPGPVERAVPAVFAGGAVLAAVVAVGLGSLPPTHRVRQSRSVRAVFVVVAVSVTVLAALIG
jgi:hypothetical protein